MNESLKSYGTNMARTIRFFRAHKRVIVFLLAFLVVAYSAFRLIHPDEFGRFYDLFGIALNVVLIASQAFWIRRGCASRRQASLGEKLDGAVLESQQVVLSEIVLVAWKFITR
jgi:hypothetical protein